MRISEEQDRRQREQEILSRLGPALDEIQELLTSCLAAYNSAFGVGSGVVRREGSTLRVRVQDPPGEVRVVMSTELPGFHVEREGFSMPVEIGLLPGDKLFYRDLDADRYLSMDDLTRRILDRVLFPKLRE
jgi:hypothetical protein